MLNSLRTRLLASYVIVLVLTLGVIAVTLMLLLQARPIPNEVNTDRLGTALQTFVQALQAKNITLTNAPPQRLIEHYFTGFATRYNIRILVTDAIGTVSYDSKTYDAKGVYNPANGFKQNAHIAFVAQPYTVNDAPVETLVRGTFNDDKGNPWLYVAQSATPANANAPLLTFAVSAQHTTLAEIIKYYGSDILQPVFEAGVSGLIIAFIFAFVIARSVARPLQEVADTAAAIAQGHLDRTAPVRGPEEVRVVAVAFNQMTREVAEGQQAQREFLANVSHDLRTPLTSIQGFSQAIIDGVAANPQVTLRAANIIHDEAARMYRMVEELLDLAQIEAGRVAMTRHGVRIGEVVSAVGDRLSLTASKKGVTIATEIVPPMPVLSGDGDRLSQVFTNLAENAIKHTPAGGTVTLRAQIQDNGVLVTVHDTGEGIPAQDLARIFERFYQVDKSRQRRDGAGLGLAITHQIVTAHNGRSGSRARKEPGHDSVCGCRCLPPTAVRSCAVAPT